MASAELFSLASTGLPDDVRVLTFEGREHLGRPYRYRIRWMSRSSDFELQDALLARARFTTSRQGGSELLVHGVLISIKLLQQEGELGVYEVELAPQLWVLGQSRHSRVHTAVSVVDAIRATLEAAGLSSDDFRFQLTGSYETEEHITQYQESDLDFVHRWLELEGMYYYFEQSDEREVLVITDHGSAHEMARDLPVHYRGGTEGDRSAGEVVWSLRGRRRILPATYRVTDYDYERPTVDVSGTSDVSPTGFGDVVEPSGRIFTPERAAHIARLRAEELLAREEVISIEGSPSGFTAGTLIEIDDHPVSEINRRYLVVEIEHFGRQEIPDGLEEVLRSSFPERVYTTRMKLLAEGTPFRLPRWTRWPSVWGFECGVIDGPAQSEYAQIDDSGRYKVKLRFDESALKDGQASTYVRMQQPHGGDVEGFHFPLRKGTEVMFMFQNGDPDRPVIAAVLPNAHTPSPVTAGNNTTNIIQTGGRNRVELEDLEGSQRVTIFSPTENSFLRMGAPNDECNMFLHTDGKGCIEVGRAFRWETGQNKEETVDHDVTETFKGPLDSAVTEGKTTEHYQDVKHETVTGTLTETYKGDTDVTVEDLCEEIYGSQETHVKGVREEDVTGNVTETYTGPMTTHVGGKVTDTYKAACTLNVTGDQTTTISGKLTETFGDYEQINTDWIQNCMASGIKVTLANGIEIMVGIKNENLVGGKIEGLIGLKFEFNSISNGVHLGAVFPTHVVQNSDTVGQAFRAYGVHLKNVGAALVEAYAAANVNNAPVHLII